MPIIRTGVCCLLAIVIMAPILLADDSPSAIKGWGKIDDPTGQSEVKLEGKTLIMKAPTRYIDNYTPGKVNAPRVEQEIEGDFVAEVNVIDVEKAQPNSVLKSLGSFPTSFHAGSMLIWMDTVNFVRFDRSSMNQGGRQINACELQVYANYDRIHLKSFRIEDKPTRLRLKRVGQTLFASFSQDDGKTWKEFPETSIKHLPSRIDVGVSMTSNTDPGCTVKFQGLEVKRLE